MSIDCFWIVSHHQPTFKRLVHATGASRLGAISEVGEVDGYEGVVAVQQTRGLCGAHCVVDVEAVSAEDEYWNESALIVSEIQI
ncbi:hypothetical protein DPMN_128086 [Dreissena polymorpha]|uniref:Uncharacterized protein n=1 Tax=Dreissena polymorpha TaxID=45954 RepID=A0A9D4JVF0_DREPO|nr:hypothetical protein DPMN_128086 [Dreissena polymorpha]